MARSKKAQRIRESSDFNAADLQRQVMPPFSSSSAYTWTVEEIVNARNAQIAGEFELPARLAVSMRTDDAMFTAYENRLDPQRALGVELKPAPGARALPIQREAAALFGAEGVGIECGAMADINGDLANHGVAFGYSTLTVREDGSRVDMLHRHWPIEHVRYDVVGRTFVTRVDPDSSLLEASAEATDDLGRSFMPGGHEVPITHGDGRWTVYQKHSYRPWRQEAAVLPAALIWARHAHGVRDWAKGSTSHGNAKVVGKLPPNIPIRDNDGAITDQANDFLTLLRGIASLDTPVGIAPAGSEVDYLMNSSRAWEVWNQLVMNAERAAARVYLGTDGMLGSIGGAPGVDIATLFGVSTTKIQGDLGALEVGFLTGVLEPWTALNFGDSALSPKRVYVIPDPDADAEREAHGKRATAFYDELDRMRAAGFVIDQPTVDELARVHGIDAPVLAVAAPAAPEAAPEGDEGDAPTLTVVN
jgi:hypothetical protein